jgi:transposase
MDWFERNCVELVEHSPYSLDLNPIKHVWVELKKRFHQQYPRIGDTPGGKKAVKKRLAQVLPLVWETIPEEFFEKLWISIPNRVAAVLEARGGYTKY